MPKPNPNAETEWPNCSDGTSTGRIVARNVKVAGYPNTPDANVFVFEGLTPQEVVTSGPGTLKNALVQAFPVPAGVSYSQVWTQQALPLARSVCAV